MTFRSSSCTHVLLSVVIFQLTCSFSYHSYLFIRGLHDREDVLSARLAVLKHIDKVKSGALDISSHKLHEGVLESRCGAGCVPFMEVTPGACVVGPT